MLHREAPLPLSGLMLSFGSEMCMQSKAIPGQKRNGVEEDEKKEDCAFLQASLYYSAHSKTLSQHLMMTSPNVSECHSQRTRLRLNFTTTTTSIASLVFHVYSAIYSAREVNILMYFFIAGLWQEPVDE